MNQRLKLNITPAANRKPAAPAKAPFNATIRRKTVMYDRIMTGKAQDEVGRTVAAARVLRDIKNDKGIDRAGWMDWLAMNKHCGEDTAANQLNVLAFSENYPTEFKKLAVLGDSGMYLIARQPERIIKALLKRKFWPIPGTRLQLTLTAMSYRQLALVIKGMAITQKTNFARGVRGMGTTMRNMRRKWQDLAGREGDEGAEELEALEREAEQFLGEIRARK